MKYIVMFTLSIEFRNFLWYDWTRSEGWPYRCNYVWISGIVLKSRSRFKIDRPLLCFLMLGGRMCCRSLGVISGTQQRVVALLLRILYFVITAGTVAPDIIFASRVAGAFINWNYIHIPYNTICFNFFFLVNLLKFHSTMTSYINMAYFEFPEKVLAWLIYLILAQCIIGNVGSIVEVATAFCHMIA